METEMTVENKVSTIVEKKKPHWYLYEHDAFRLSSVDAEGKGYKHAAQIPFGVTVTIEQAEKNDRFRGEKGKKVKYGRGKIVEIEKEGKKIDSLEIDESSIDVGDKIEIYLPQQHTRKPERRKKTKNFPGQSPLDEEVFKKVS
jgi:hypothetical protein